MPCRLAPRSSPARARRGGAPEPAIAVRAGGEQERVERINIRLWLTTVWLGLLVPAHEQAPVDKLPQLPPGQSLGIALGIPTVPNLRDVGGHATRDGKTVARGIAYRSDSFNPMSAEEIEKLARLALKNDYDLRTRTVNSAAAVLKWRYGHLNCAKLSGLPLSGRDHRPLRVAVLPLLPELWRRAGDDA